MRELSLGVSRDNVEIRGDVAQLDLAEDRVLVRDLRLHGATGELNGNAELTPHTLSVTRPGPEPGFVGIFRVLGLPRGVLEGRASLSVDAVSDRQDPARHAGAFGQQGYHLASLSDISGQLSAKLDGRQLTGASTGRVEALGGFSADWDTELDGPPTERASFERATGSATLALNDVTLDYLGQLLPEQELDVGGHGIALARASRAAIPTPCPNLELSGRNQGPAASALRAARQDAASCSPASSCWRRPRTTARAATPPSRSAPRKAPSG